MQKILDPHSEMMFLSPVLRSPKSNKLKSGNPIHHSRNYRPTPSTRAAFTALDIVSIHLRIWSNSCKAVFFAAKDGREHKGPLRARYLFATASKQQLSSSTHLPSQGHILQFACKKRKSHALPLCLLASHEAQRAVSGCRSACGRKQRSPWRCCYGLSFWHQELWTVQKEEGRVASHAKALPGRLSPTTGGTSPDQKIRLRLSWICRKSTFFPSDSPRSVRWTLSRPEEVKISPEVSRQMCHEKDEKVLTARSSFSVGMIMV